MFTLLCREIAQRAKTPVAFELKFHPKRKWRFDAAFPEKMVAVELDGGVWMQGRHTRGKGFINDLVKINEAQLLGWKVFRFVPDDLDSGEFFRVIEQALGIGGKNGEKD